MTLRKIALGRSARLQAFTKQQAKDDQKMPERSAPCAVAGASGPALARGIASPAAARAEPWLLAGLMLIAALPVWTVRYFPSMDGPIHVWISEIIADYRHSPILQQYLTFSGRLDPNLAVYGVLFLLERLADASTAEKLFVTLWFALLCLGGWYAVRAVDRGASAVGLMFVPLGFTSFVHYGFYNFCLSMTLFLFGFGYWFRREGNLRLRDAAVLLVFNLALVLTHLVGFISLALTVGATFAARLAEDLHARYRAGAGTGSGVRPLGARVREAIYLSLAFLPAGAVVLGFLDREAGGVMKLLGEELWRPLARIATMRHLYSFGELEMLLFAPLLLLVAGLLAVALHGRFCARAWTRADVLLAVLLALIGVSFLNPVSAREVLLSARLEPFVLFVTLLWLASTALPRSRTGRALTAGVVALVVVLTAGYRTIHYARLNDVLREYASIADHVASGSTLLALDLWATPAPLAGERLTWRIDPFRHVAAHVARERGGIYLRASLLSPTAFGYFPVEYRDAYDPFRHIGPGIDNLVPPDGDLLGYDEHTPGRIDYVVLWGAEGDVPLGPDAPTTALRQLGAAYEQVFVSQPRGLARLYRHRPAEAARSR